MFGNCTLTFTVTEASELLDPHVLTCILPGLDVGDGRQYQQYNKIAAQPSQFLWGPTAEAWGAQALVAPEPETYQQWKLGAILLSSGTVGTISSGPAPWTAVIAVTSTAGIVIGATLSATNGTGSLYGGNPVSVLVTNFFPNTSIDYTVTGVNATAPQPGTVTDIIATPPLTSPPIYSTYSQESIYKQLYPNSN